MITDITESTLPQIKNPKLRQQAGIYVHIYQDFMHQIRQLGVEIEDQDNSIAIQERLVALDKQGARIRNNRNSVSHNQVSTACIACRQGTGSATFFISLQCHRDCFYCFNPNQQEFDQFQQQSRDVARELRELKAIGQRVHHLALTGGEPLLHREASIEFFEEAQRSFPEAHTRLYTTGDQLNPELLQQLKDAGLQEIRFSIRMHDTPKAKEHTFNNIALAKEYIPEVMVEMPIMPNTVSEMKEILLKLDGLGVYSINLLELCFPLHNAEAFRERGYKIKARPYRVLYNYWYAGGLPVAGSEEACLDLLEFAIEQDLAMGVHYCSLENKHTGQVYQQNKDQDFGDSIYFSEHDYFLKSAKVFGDDIPTVKGQLEAQGYKEYQFDPDQELLEFHVSKIKLLKELDVEIGISTAIHEIRNGESVLRELKLDVTTPQQFKMYEV